MAYMNKRAYKTPVPSMAVEARAVEVKPMITRKMTPEECIKYGVIIKQEGNKMNPVETVRNGLPIEEAEVMTPADLTKDDVEFLLANGVIKAAIKRAYGFHSDGTFYRALEKIGLVADEKKGLEFKPIEMPSFVCPICDKKHDYMDDAQACIGSHVLPTEIVNVQGYADTLNVPVNIYVMLTDGRTVMYRLEEVVAC